MEARDEPWSLFRYKASSYYYAYGYGYHLLLVLFLLYVIQSYNDYCYYYLSMRSLGIILTFHSLKYIYHSVYVTLCNVSSVQMYINELAHE